MLFPEKTNPIGVPCISLDFYIIPHCRLFYYVSCVLRYISRPFQVEYCSLKFDFYT